MSDSDTSQTENDINSLLKTLDETTSLNDVFDNDNSDLSTSLDTLEDDINSKIDDLTKQINELEKTKNTLIETNKSLENEKTKLNLELNTLNSSKGNLDSQLLSLDEKIKKKEKDYDKITKKCKLLHTNTATLLNKYKELKDIYITLKKNESDIATRIRKISKKIGSSE